MTRLAHNLFFTLAYRVSKRLSKINKKVNKNKRLCLYFLTNVLCSQCGPQPENKRPWNRRVIDFLSCGFPLAYDENLKTGIGTGWHVYKIVNIYITESRRRTETRLANTEQEKRMISLPSPCPVCLFFPRVPSGTRKKIAAPSQNNKSVTTSGVGEGESPASTKIRE